MKHLFAALALLSVQFLLPPTPDAAEPPCLNCHKDKRAGAIVHPALDMGCDACHTGTHSGGKPAPKLAAPVPGLCFLCHDKNTLAMRDAHVRAAAGQCLSCHEPHGSDAAFVLNQLVEGHCTSCHDEITPMHVLARVSPNNSHPLNKRPDPLRAGRELSCSSCHNPHAIGQARVSTKGLKNPAPLCARCHRKIRAGS